MLLTLLISSSLSTSTLQNTIPAGLSTYNLPASKIPYQLSNTSAPIINAASAISLDLDSGIKLYEKDSNKKLPPASITKLMTAIIALEENKIDETVTVPDVSKIEGSKIWLKKNEQISLGNLIKAALIPSANDAAYSIAIHNAGSMEKFAEKMNKKAHALGMYDTHFKNSIGLDEKDHYSTAHDLAILGTYAMKKDFIKKTVIQKEAVIESTNGSTSYKLTSTNELLSSYLKVLGLKTGTTDEAGPCLISVVQNQNGSTIINVILNSPDRFQESKLLSEWVFDSFTWT